MDIHSTKMAKQRLRNRIYTTSLPNKNRILAHELEKINNNFDSKHMGQYVKGYRSRDRQDNSIKKQRRTLALKPATEHHPRRIFESNRTLESRTSQQSRNCKYQPFHFDNSFQNRPKQSETVPSFNYINFPTSEIETFYNKQFRHNLASCLDQWVSILQRDNVLFRKISPVIAEALAKLGFVCSYNLKDVILKDNEVIKVFGIILWGQIQLINKHNSTKYKCFPGSALGEELIFEAKDKPKSGILVKNGQFLSVERCTASSSCGILFIGEREYRWLCQFLFAQGLKNLVVGFQNTIKRTYLKKLQFRHNQDK